MLSAKLSPPNKMEAVMAIAVNFGIRLIGFLSFQQQ
jgi:hypothetical protein